MQQILGDEYPAFLESYNRTRNYGLRVNTLKLTPEAFEKLAPFHLTPVKWIPGAYYYIEEDRAARHPFYHAGLYYLQEPSAMTPASVLDVKPGDKVLDLCAAPGGKSTALGAKLRGQGLLVANDISASRCKALLKNIEVFGIPNALVTNAAPAKLAERFPEFFDAVLVDAPCSGEGMFRKDEATIRAWYPEKPAECAKIQKEIVLKAAAMLRPGGKMLYSTCTFATEEDEEMIRFLLDNCPDMELLEIPYREGFAPGLAEFGEDMTRCVRLWPHKTGGEGHFQALLRKKGEAAERVDSLVSVASESVGLADSARIAESRDDSRSDSRSDVRGGKGKKGKRGDSRGSVRTGSGRSGDGRFGNARSAGRAADAGADAGQILQSFFGEMHRTFDPTHFEIHGEQVYYDTGLVPDVRGITFLRNGLYLGELKKGRFEPSQALAMALRAEDTNSRVDFSSADERVMRYLRGETVILTEEEAAQTGSNSWKLICVDGYPLGWAKLTGMQLKNKYLAGWRTKY